jgi:hypothetical protein
VINPTTTRWCHNMLSLPKCLKRAMACLQQSLFDCEAQPSASHVEICPVEAASKSSAEVQVVGCQLAHCDLGCSGKPVQHKQHAQQAQQQQYMGSARSDVNTPWRNSCMCRQVLQQDCRHVCVFRAPFRLVLCWGACNFYAGCDCTACFSIVGLKWANSSNHSSRAGGRSYSRCLAPALPLKASVQEVGQQVGHEPAATGGSEAYVCAGGQQAQEQACIWTIPLLLLLLLQLLHGK